ncbi:hypothetical protein NQ317_016262 [Molorchus minor]|uniref:Nuclease HARBI1 n=1 Tax=Molorchus minor TaxID=1323400 RepID=A0ABQ9JXS6_9CUCU|nr:hypothetical protein NQ317_016262 [Molorchus minor]
MDPDWEDNLEFFGVRKFCGRRKPLRVLYGKRIPKQIQIFKKYFVLPLISDRLTKINNRGLPFAPLIQLLVCLRFYATGNFQCVAGDLRGVSQQSVSVIIKRVSVLLAEQRRRFIKFLDTENGQRQNITRFAQNANFPGVGACVDGTHSHTYCQSWRYQCGSVSEQKRVLFTKRTAGPRMEIMDIVVRHPGSTHDSAKSSQWLLYSTLSQKIIVTITYLK